MATPIPMNEASFSVWELAAITEGDLTRVPDESARVVGVVTDSRAVTTGNVFVAVVGDKLDGHDFIDGAVMRGARVVIVERGRSVTDPTVAVVEVDSAVRALGQLASAHIAGWRRAHPASRVVAVTGSAGKTTTKELLATLLSRVGACHATAGNLNNRLGVPSVAFGLRDQAFAVFELGMNSAGEIADLTRIVAPDVALLLNVGVAHAEGFGGSRAAIAREKGAIFAGLGEGGVAVVNADDAAASAQLTRTRSSVEHRRFGVGDGADVRIVRRESVAGARSNVTLARGVETFDVVLPVPGDAVAIDLAGAIAAADAAVGRPIPADLIRTAIASWSPPAGRALTFDLAGDLTVVDDSYNANPASMRAAFATLVELSHAGAAHRRAICVLGEMRELGPISRFEHEALGDELARHAFDVVIGCGGEIDVSLERAARGGVVVHSARDASQAGDLLLTLVRRGDIVLFKGSRGAAVERALITLEARHPRVPHARGTT